MLSLGGENCLKRLIVIPTLTEVRSVHTNSESCNIQILRTIIIIFFRRIRI